MPFYSSSAPVKAFEAAFPICPPVNKPEPGVPEELIAGQFWMFADQLEALLDEDSISSELPVGDPALDRISARAQAAWEAAIGLAEDIIAWRRSAATHQLSYCRAAMYARLALRAKTASAVDNAVGAVEGEFRNAMRTNEHLRMACSIGRCWALLVQLREAWRPGEHRKHREN